MKSKLFAFFLMLYLLWASAIPALAVVGDTFNDQFTEPELARAVAQACGKEPGEAIEAPDIDQLTSLDAHHLDLATLDGLELFTNLSELDVSENWGLQDVSALTGLTNLTHLDFSNIPIFDLQSLSGLTNLTWLDLSHDEVRYITDLSPLSGLLHLTHLELQGNDALADLGPLSNLTDLTYLDIRYTGLGSLEPLDGLMNLTYLDLSSNPNISDLAPLSSLTSLTYLGLARNQITEIRPLSNLTALNSLNLSHNKIRDLSPLAAATSLQLLDFSDNEVGDIKGLASLVHLKELYFDENRITDISPLSGLPLETFSGTHQWVPLDDATVAAGGDLVLKNIVVGMDGSLLAPWAVTLNFEFSGDAGSYDAPYVTWTNITEASVCTYHFNAKLEQGEFSGEVFANAVVDEVAVDGSGADSPDTGDPGHAGATLLLLLGALCLAFFGAGPREDAR